MGRQRSTARHFIDHVADLTIKDYRYHSNAEGWARYRAQNERMADLLAGEPALACAGSRAISDAVEAGAGRVETLELGHRYGHLSPLATVV